MPFYGTCRHPRRDKAISRGEITRRVAEKERDAAAISVAVAAHRYRYRIGEIRQADIRRTGIGWEDRTNIAATRSTAPRVKARGQAPSGKAFQRCIAACLWICGPSRIPRLSPWRARGLSSHCRCWQDTSGVPSLAEEQRLEKTRYQPVTRQTRCHAHPPGHFDDRHDRPLRPPAWR